MRGECNFGVQSECVLGLAFLCWVPVCVGPINGPHPVLSVGLCVGRPVNARGTGAAELAQAMRTDFALALRPPQSTTRF